ncbi:hypothetical protein O181_040787 [Austropuccinia psidii MF-1]|uniref:Uncharacterized protein n=1 Tax=Austropuccinia psidii MF-1 TaxID=1389203 RepID=A0A9Q3HE86_9BASI|nr:hypothetical protein [Austropuccinia psidii MF-1]
MWNNVRGPIPTGGRPIKSISEVPISRINSQGVVTRIRKISDFPTNPDGEGSDELNGEEVEVFDQKFGQFPHYSPYNPPSQTFHTQVIPSIPRNCQPRLATFPSSVHQSSPNQSTSRTPVLASPMRLSPITQSRHTQISPHNIFQPVARTSSPSGVERSPLPYPADEVF